MNNTQKRIRKAYEDHQRLYQEDYINTPIVHQNITCFTYEGIDKVRFRVYKNFQIYLVNYWGLLNITNNTNDDFEKLRNKIVAYCDNVTRKNQRDLREDIELILETVVLERELILIVDDIVLLILSVTVSTGNFTVEGLIEEVHKFAYKSLIEAGNYLGSDSTESPLIDYVALIINRRKDKNKLSQYHHL